MTNAFAQNRFILAMRATGAVAGVLVGGLGGRLVMRLSAIAADAGVIGAVTENGNRVGESTAEGTIGLVGFGGLFLGISGSILVHRRTALAAMGRAAPWPRLRGVRPRDGRSLCDRRRQLRLLAASPVG